MPDKIRQDIGKNSAEIKTCVPDELKEALIAMAFIDEMTLSEYVREVLADHAFGRIHKIRIKERSGRGKSRNTDDSGNN